MSHVNITTIGGGSGQPALLRALKQFSGVELSAIVTTMDSGGSSGVLREEYGILPPGDIRRCLSALSSHTELDAWWNFRLNDGLLAGHPVGNIVLTQLTKKFGSMEKAIAELEKVFVMQGHVYPVSQEAGVLCAELADGSIVRGEHEIDVPAGVRAPISRVFLEQPLTLAPAARQALETSDVIVLSFGDVWTSVIPNLLVSDVPLAIAESEARVVLVCNRTTKKGETDGWSYMDIVNHVSSCLAPAHLSAVICDNQIFPVPSSHQAFTVSELPTDLTVISDDFGDREHPEHLSAQSVAQAIVSYAHLR
ncbi:MAG: YvcK family protein [Candidatus Kerfeldbacteria bacterium]|nr:YvcK family protein [Candidatus Kerfeldbacteria bacterium]